MCVCVRGRPEKDKGLSQRELTSITSRCSAVSICVPSRSILRGPGGGGSARGGDTEVAMVILVAVRCRLARRSVMLGAVLKC